MMHRFAMIGLVLSAACTMTRAAEQTAEKPKQPAPIPVAQATKAMTFPSGFNVTLFAGEPDLVQPIAFCTDDRGRLWVAENYSYPKWAPEGRDRILIFEDTDGDGRFDKKTVFVDNLGYLTGLQIGFGGVWAASAPNLLFYPLKDGEDKPAGPPQILLEGWTWKGVHNVVDSLTWGLDGWLYGCHGITVPSDVSKPGEAEHTPVGPGVWRYHPTKRIFEYVCEGTCNPWGIDWNDLGDAFITTSVVPHIFHVIPGAHYERMHGHDFNPYVYGQIHSIVDHLHHAGGSWKDWSKSRGGEGITGDLGGGHSHAGAMIYLADLLPEQYRGTIFMCNIHGNRINNDSLARKESGYVASHRPDFLMANDKWFRGVTIQQAPGGSIYFSDWSDTGECHGHDAHRENGRVYRLTYGEFKAPQVDLTKLTDAQLVELHLSRDEWYVRHARRILQERGGSPQATEPLRKILTDNPDITRKLRALWTLHCINALDEKQNLALLSHSDEHIRAWAIQFLAEDKHASAAALSKFTDLAKSDPSPFVRLYLASAMQRTPLKDRWAVLEALAAHAEDVSDQNLPFMYWYAIEPLAATKETSRSLHLLSTTKIPMLREYITRRMAAAATQPATQN